ncbi:MAG TPA: hypothetical protein VKX49_18180 [Bryobacteraceae bacterium]|nr:hypothetical protein [Bryobacteraceae bacterium]
MQEQSTTTVYRVHTPLVAQEKEGDGHLRFVAIPRGSMMYVPGKLESFGFVDVQCDGKTLAVFSRDIRERAEKVDNPSQITPTPRGESRPAR